MRESHKPRMALMQTTKQRWLIFMNKPVDSHIVNVSKICSFIIRTPSPELYLVLPCKVSRLNLSCDLATRPLDRWNISVIALKMTLPQLCIIVYDDVLSF